MMSKEVDLKEFTSRAEQGGREAARLLLLIFCARVEMKGSKADPLDRFLADGFGRYLDGERDLAAALGVKRARGGQVDDTHERHLRDTKIALTVALLREGDNGEKGLTYQEAIARAASSYHLSERQIESIYSHWIHPKSDT